MELDSAEREELEAFLVEVYGSQAARWSMTAGMLALTLQLLDRSRKCSDLMDLGPRPIHPGQSAAKWLSKQARGVLMRKLKKRRKHYAACVRTVALKMKVKFAGAASGL